jgi:hypothetical protein
MGDFETLNDCLIECVKAAGGSKTVGHRLWPEKAVDAAQRHLLACLNDTKAERLTPDHVMLLARLARDRGCHAYAEFVAQQLSYSAPVPVQPRDEADQLRREMLEMGKSLQAALARLEAVDARQPLRVA